MPTTASGGFTGKTLRVDLTTRTITVEPTLGVWSNGHDYSKFWGGTGQAYKVLWDEVPASVKPFDPENRLIFGWGPLAGTSVPANGRTCITSLWPLHTKYAVATGHMGGHFCADAKFAGWDGIIVQGKAPGPVYIAIRDDDVQIVDCPKMWGTGIYNATAEITAAMGPGCQVAAIGQAGENLVEHSTIETGESHSAGGLGSVMGSKNLKAIGVIGTGEVKIAADKKSWRALIDYAMSLIGAQNQKCVPNTPQPWAEYTNSAGWPGRKGLYWGSADPAVEMGTCDPHDRQSVGYRMAWATNYFTSIADDYCVREDGCFGCPIRCHVRVNVPSARKWGVHQYAQNVCNGPWGDMMNAAKYPAGVEGKIRAIEAKVVGINMTDDLGLWNNYGLLNRIYTFIYGADKGVTWIQPNVPAAEWTQLNASGGMFDMFEKGDLGFIKEWGRRVTYKEGALGKFLAGPIDASIDSWYDKDGNPLGPAVRGDTTIAYWQWGFPKHHSNDQGGQVGALLSTGYNRDAQNHSTNKILASGFPVSIIRPLIESGFAANGWGPGMSAAIDNSYTDLTRMNVAKAKLAKFGILRKELQDSLPGCGWVYPWYVSPLKERGYEGDLAMEAKMYSAVTGDTKDMAALDKEAERFYTLQRCLTIRSFSDLHLRTYHDQLPSWALASHHPGVTPFTPGNYYLEEADWELALDLFYDEFGYDRATGAPKQSTMDALGMTDVKNELAALGLTLPV